MAVALVLVVVVVLAWTSYKFQPQRCSPKNEEEDEQNEVEMIKMTDLCSPAKKDSPPNTPDLDRDGTDGE